MFKRDRKGTLLDKDNKPVADDDPKKFKKAVHLTSIHLDLGHALRRLPLLAGRARQRPHLRRSRGGGRNRLRRLPRHGQQVSDAVHQRPRCQAGRTRPVTVAHPGRPQAFRVARRQALPALGARPGTRMGDDAGQGQRHAGPSELQREGGARQAHARRARGAMANGASWSEMARPSTRMPTKR